MGNFGKSISTNDRRGFSCLSTMRTSLSTMRTSLSTIWTSLPTMRTSLAAVWTCFLLTFFVVSPVRAQVGDLRRNLAFGVSAGGCLNRVDFSPSIKQNYLPGINGGLVVRYTSEKYFSMICATQIELNYVQRGWKENITDGSNNTYSRTTHYVEVPFLVHLGVGQEQRGAQFFFNAGPLLGWYLNSTEHYGYSEEEPWSIYYRSNGIVAQYGSEPGDPTSPGKAVENSLEYGIAAGAGVELKTGVGNFTVEGRYYFGLSDMFGNSKADPFGRSANQTIYARISYLIDILR